MERRAHARPVLPSQWNWRRLVVARAWRPGMDRSDDRSQEQGAVFQLYRIYDLAPVVWENPRPEQTDTVGGGQEEVRMVRARKKAKSRGS